jgi:hypothetical protein
LQKNENKATKELAQTPLLLTFLCLVYDRQHILPTQRSTLYGKALDILLSEWSAQKRLEHDPIYEGFHPDLEKVLLAQIAYDSFEQDQLFFLKDDIIRQISDFLADTLDAPKHLDGGAVLKAIEKQQGILVERATGIYSFSHLTLQEYLTALYVKEEGIENLTVENHLSDERWQEVFILTSGLKARKSIDLLTKINEKTRSFIAEDSKLKRLLSQQANFFGDLASSSEHLKSKFFFLFVVASIACMDVEIEPTRDRLEFTMSCPLSVIRINEFVFKIPVSRTFLGGNFMIDLMIAAKSSVSVGLTLEKEQRWSADFLGIEFVGLIDNEAEKFFIAFLETAKKFINSYMEKAIESLGEIMEMSYVQKTSSIRIDNLEFFVDNLRNRIITLKEELEGLHLNSNEWRVWGNQIELVFLKMLSLDKIDLELTAMEAQRLTNYLHGSELLIRCKDSAIHIPKKAWADLEARLLTV